MGNTLEAIIEVVLGVTARGDPATQRQLDRRTGVGWVAETTDHDYADAQSKHIPVTLLSLETTGAFSPPLERCLRALDREARAPGACDATYYGRARSSPRQYYAHHAARVSHAAVAADAHTLLRSREDLDGRLLIIGPARASDGSDAPPHHAPD